MQLACSLRSPLDDEPYYAAREAIGSSLSVRAAAEPQRQLSGTSIAAVRADKLAKVTIRDERFLVVITCAFDFVLNL